MDTANAQRIAFEEAKNAVLPPLVELFSSTSKGSGENNQYGAVLMVKLTPSLIKFATPYYKMAFPLLKRKVNAVCSGFQRYTFRTNLRFRWSLYTSIVSFWSLTNFVTRCQNFVTSLRNLLPQLPEPQPPYASGSSSLSGSRLLFIPPCPRLPNIGSTCFFNSTLQVLLTVKDILLSCFEQAKTGCVHVIKYQNDTKSIRVTVTFAERPMISAFLEFLQAVKAEENINAKLQQLHSRIGERYKRFSSFNQQDSEEVLRCLLDGIRMEEIEAVKEKIPSKLKGNTGEESENGQILKECLRATFKLNTLVDKIFGGSCVNTVICRECLHPLQLIEPFLDLSVPMPDNNEPVSPNTETPKDPSTCPTLLQQHLKEQDTPMFTRLEMNPEFSPPPDHLEHCLKLFTSLDVLDEDNKFICDHCTKKNQQEGSSDNREYAECLVSKQLLIHQLPRILILHMKRFHLGLRVTKNNNHITFSDVLNVAPFCSDLSKGGMVYDLYGVVQHSGSLQGGHYVAYVKYKSTKDRVGEAGGGEPGYSHTTRAGEDYGYWTEGNGGQGGFSSEGAERYGHHNQAEACEMGELGYQKSSKNVYERADQKEDIWYYTSDSNVSVVGEEDVHDSQAYLLLYVQRN